MRHLDACWYVYSAKQYDIVLVSNNEICSNEYDVPFR